MRVLNVRPGYLVAWTANVLCAFSMSAIGAQDFGDVVELVASAGQIAGRIDTSQNPNGNQRSGQVTLQTESGGRIVLDLGSVARVLQSSQQAIDTYYAFAEGLEDTVEDHWRAVEWCLAQPSGKVTYERFLRRHLLRIVELDPNDKRAAGTLNSLPQPIQLVQRNNRWYDERLLMASHGYQYDRKWGSHLQSAISAEARAAEQAKKEFLLAFRRWEQRVRNMDRLTAANELQALLRDHPSAIPQLVELAKKEENSQKRLVMIETIGASPSQVAGNALILFAIEDGDSQIRDRAQTLLLQPQYNRVVLVDKLRAYLRHNNNDYVQRAGALMGELGTFNAVLPLIDALVTKHSVPNPLAQLQGQMNLSIGSGGIGFQPGGNGQPKLITRDMENHLVLTALRRITQPLSPPDMRFDEARWSSWYAQIMSSGKDLRRDD